MSPRAVAPAPLGPAAPAPARDALRIGDVARQVGTTPRTIRYYEEMGLLGDAGRERPAGGHRVYSRDEVQRLRELIRLRDLLGVSLEQLGELVEAEAARALLREEWDRRRPGRARRREILTEALGHLDRQLELVRDRVSQLRVLEDELTERRERVTARLRTQ